MRLRLKASIVAGAVTSAALVFPTPSYAAGALCKDEAGYAVQPGYYVVRCSVSPTRYYRAVAVCEASPGDNLRVSYFGAWVTVNTNSKALCGHNQPYLFSTNIQFAN
jgi:hypothetical protein